MQATILITCNSDFIFYCNGVRVIIEAKGFQNDVFYIKKKLFRAYLEEDFLNVKIQSLYFEIYTKKELMQALTADFADDTI